MEELIAATPEGKDRVEAGYARMAEASLRASAATQPSGADVAPPASSAHWFRGDIAEWRAWKVAEKQVDEYPAWRKQ